MDTVRLWLASARDAEVLALLRLVAVEADGRGLAAGREGPPP